MNKYTAFAPAAGLLILALSTAASAGTVDASILSLSPAQYIGYSLDGGANFHTTLAGEFTWLRAGGTEPNHPHRTFNSFCIEITQYVGFGAQYTYELADLAGAPDPGGSGVGMGMGLAKADLLSELWGRHFDEIADDGPTAARNKGAAFQLAVWEIVYDDDLILDQGSFRARYPSTLEPAYLTIAEDWLASLDGTGPRQRLGAIRNPLVQDQVIALAPSPAAAGGGAALLLALAAHRAWRRRYQAA